MERTTPSVEALGLNVAFVLRRQILGVACKVLLCPQWVLGLALRGAPLSYNV